MKSFLDSMRGPGAITKWCGKGLLPTHSEKILRLMTHRMEVGLEQVSPLGVTSPTLFPQAISTSVPL